MPDFLPRKESELLPFTRNFSARIVANPETYCVTESAAERLAQLQGEYEWCYRLASEPATRTTPAIVARAHARAELVKQIRHLAAAIRSNREVSDATLILVGLKRASKSRTRFPRPTSHPTLRVLGTRGTRVTIQLTDSAAPHRKGMPYGILAAELYYSFHESLSSDPTRWKLDRGYNTRARRVVELPPGFAPGARVWFAARWINTTGKPGPYGPACQTRVLGVDVKMPSDRLNAA